MSQITNLDSLSIGRNGADAVTISSAGLSLTTVSVVTGSAITATASLTVSGYLTTKVGAATAGANLTALPSSKSFYRMNATLSTNLKGIVAGVDGQQLDLYFKAGTHTLTITPSSTAAGSTARILLMTTAASAVTTGSGFASFIYSADDTKWLLKYLST